MVNIPIKLLFLMMIFLTGCVDLRMDVAPVGGGQPSNLSSTGQHRVKAGETLYSIAWAYGQDVRALARLNDLSVPYDIRPNQVIFIQKPKNQLKRTVVAKSDTVSSKHSVISSKVKEMPKEVRKKSVVHQGFLWPVDGKVISEYSGAQLGGNQGIDIAGQLGTPIRAVSGGKVVYRGEGIRGYGLLIIIKHPGNFLSAYAHNRKILVQEGALIKAGDIIAEMGNSGTDKVKLHFEIRKNGKPVDPKDYLS